jgi:hypothetical protein
VAIRSKRLKAISMEEGLPEGLSYCRRCMKIKRVTDFHKAVDHELDKNELFSVCKSCIDSLYESIFNSENGSVHKTILRLCRMLNVAYNENAISAALTHIESKGSDKMRVFGLYRAKLLIMERSDVSDTNVDLTYKDSPIINLPPEDGDRRLTEDTRDLSLFWGTNFTIDELEILESKYSEWTQSHSIDTQSERVLLKYICLKEYEIDKAVKSGSNTSSLMKEFQDLLKTSALSPSTATISSGGKAQETWGNFIKVIEETTPAEYYKDDDLFKDYDNINWIWQNFVVRSIKNFLTGSRDFNLTDIDTDYEEEEELVDVDETPPLEYKTEE